MCLLLAAGTASYVGASRIRDLATSTILKAERVA
jgi:hypothetical protein